MNDSVDPYAMLWQELSQLHRLVQQFDVLLAMLLAYTLLLFVGSGLVLVSAVLKSLVQRVEESGEAPQERMVRRAAPALQLSRRKYRPHVRPIRLDRRTPGRKATRWRSTFPPYFHRPR